MLAKDDVSFIKTPHITNVNCTFSKSSHNSLTKLINVHLFSSSKQYNMNRPESKPTVWPLHNVSTQISLRSPRRLI